MGKQTQIKQIKRIKHKNTKTRTQQLLMRERERDYCNDDNTNLRQTYREGEREANKQDERFFGQLVSARKT